MMGTCLACSLQSAICLSVCYLLYKALLSRETFHAANRLTLLSIMALSVVVPLVAQWSPQDLAPQAVATETSFVHAMPHAGIRWADAALLIYLCGCAALLLQMLLALTAIIRLLTRSVCYQTGGIRIAQHADSRVAPFSWMNCIVISEHDADTAGRLILRHEEAHIRCRHSIDLVFARLCLIFQWYNPVAWMVYAELQCVHEYEADRFVLRSGVDAREYQHLLIRKTVGEQRYALADGFNHNNLKKRITMMLQKKSNFSARLKYTCVLPLVAVCATAFAQPEIARRFQTLSDAQVDRLFADQTPPEQPKMIDGKDPANPKSPSFIDGKDPANPKPPSFIDGKDPANPKSPSFIDGKDPANPKPPSFIDGKDPANPKSPSFIDGKSDDLNVPAGAYPPPSKVRDGKPDDPSVVSDAQHPSERAREQAIDRQRAVQRERADARVEKERTQQERAAVRVEKERTQQERAAMRAEKERAQQKRAAMRAAEHEQMQKEHKSALKEQTKVRKEQQNRLKEQTKVRKEEQTMRKKQTKARNAQIKAHKV